MEAGTAPPADAAEQQGQQPAPEQPAEPTNAELAEQLRVLGEKFNGTPAEEPAPVTDLAGAFAAGTEDDQYDPQEEQNFGEDAFDLYDENTGQVDPQVAELLQRQQDTEAYLIGEAQRKNADALGALGQKYPDLLTQETVDKVQTELQAIGDELGYPDLANNPPASLVEKVYKSLKADEESANETPAEEAVGQGASLETGAGPGNQEGETSPEETYGDAIVAASKRGKSAFTSP